MAKAVGALIFDIGGVIAFDVWEFLLLDRESGIASRWGLRSDHVQRIGAELWNDFAYQTASGKHWQDQEVEYWQAFAKRLSLAPESIDTFINLTDEFIRPVNGMIELLDQLSSNGIPMALCSNNTEFWFQRQWNKLKLDRFFQADKTVVSCRIGAAKASSEFEMFKAVVSALSVNSSECLLIDDRMENIQQALEFGLGGILFPSHEPDGAKYLAALLERMPGL